MNNLCCLLTPFKECVHCKAHWCYADFWADTTHYTASDFRREDTGYFCPKMSPVEHRSYSYASEIGIIDIK